MLFTRCSEADGCEICLPSFPNLRVMLLQGDEGEGAEGCPRRGRPCPVAGLMPGLCLPWIGKKADSALQQTGEKPFPASLGGVRK